jgi:hypothetical protein
VSLFDVRVCVKSMEPAKGVYGRRSSQPKNGAMDGSVGMAEKSMLKGPAALKSCFVADGSQGSDGRRGDCLR